MRKTITFLVALLCATFIAGCSTPGQPGCMPGAEDAAANDVAGVGGIRGESKPETGRVTGVPNPTSTYARGNADVDSDYKTESRQAGAISNPKSWTADMRLISSAPMSVKFTAQLLETYAMDLARSKDPEERASIRADMAALVDKAESHQTRWIGAIAALAPSFDRCVLVQIDGSGSSTGGQPAVNPDNANVFAEGTSKVLQAADKILNAEFAEEGPAPTTGEARSDPPAGSGGNPLEDPKPTPPANGGGS